MSLRVTCEKCGSSHSLNKRLLGRSMRCPVCDATIAVPSTLANVEDRNEQLGDMVAGELVDVELVDSELVDGELVDVVEVDAAGVAENVAGVVGQGASDFDDRESKSDRSVRASDDEDLPDIAFAKRELPKDDMDMTPMVDVTFLLLIFFMITASFTSEKVFEEPPPLSDEASTNAKEEPDKILDTVRVQVDEFNAYTIILPGGEDRQASSKQDLLIALDDARKELITGANDNALKLAVEAHTESMHAAVVAALDVGREKGFSSIQVTVVEEFD